MTQKRALLAIITAATLFGTLGAFRLMIPDVPSAWLAACRGVVGAAFLYAWALLRRIKLNRPALRRNAVKLILSGAFIGLNWILLFEAYRYTSIARATLAYYMAPLFVILGSAVLFREKLTVRRILCVMAAVGGMVLVSGIFDAQSAETATARGVLLGLGAGVMYASIVLINKSMRDLAAVERTVVQLAVAGVVVIPYAALVEPLDCAVFTPTTVAVVALLAVVHTGVAYALFYAATAALPAASVAMASYLDPAVAVFLGALLPSQPALRWFEWLGVALILGGAVVSEGGSKTRIPRCAEKDTK